MSFNVLGLPFIVVLVCSGPSHALLLQHDAIPVALGELLGSASVGEDEELPPGW